MAQSLTSFLSMHSRRPMAAQSYCQIAVMAGKYIRNLSLMNPRPFSPFPLGVTFCRIGWPLICSVTDHDMIYRPADRRRWGQAESVLSCREAEDMVCASKMPSPSRCLSTLLLALLGPAVASPSSSQARRSLGNWICRVEGTINNNSFAASVQDKPPAAVQSVEKRQKPRSVSHGLTVLC